MSQRLCEGCRRPKRVCLCAAYPPSPIPTTGSVFILQHPLEHRRSLATVPLVEHLLQHCIVVRDRKFQPGKHQKLDKVLDEIACGKWRGFLLFPGAGAVSLDTAVHASTHFATLTNKQVSISAANSSVNSHKDIAQQQPASDQPQSNVQHHTNAAQATDFSTPACCTALQSMCSTSNPGNRSLFHQAASVSAEAAAALAMCAEGEQAQQQIDTQNLAATHDLPYILFVIDGTWQEAKEIYKAVAPRMLTPSSHIQQVQLPGLTQSIAQNTKHMGRQDPPAAGVSKAHGFVTGCCLSATEQGHPCSTMQDRQPTSWLLRAEPSEGCVTTAEAVARAVAILEGDDGPLLEQLLAPLKLMTQLQAADQFQHE